MRVLVNSVKLYYINIQHSRVYIGSSEELQRLTPQLTPQHSQVKPDIIHNDEDNT